MRNQTLKEGAINSAKRMLADGILTLEKIADFVKDFLIKFTENLHFRAKK